MNNNERFNKRLVLKRKEETIISKHSSSKNRIRKEEETRP